MLIAIIDYIDGAHARVLIGDEGVAVVIPTTELPPRMQDGMVLRLKFTVDQAATAARDRAIAGRRHDHE